MIRFLTPIRGAVSSDIQARYKVLNNAPSDLRLGGELILLEDDYTKEDLIVENLRNSIFPIKSVHVPFPQVGGDYESYNIFSSSGQDKMHATARIAERIGASIVVVHSQFAFSYDEWTDNKNSLAWRDELFNTVFLLITEFNNKYPTLQFCLENMPLPLFADSPILESDVRYNPCIITFEDMERAVVAGIKITWDICHYDMMRRVLHSWLQHHGKIDQTHIKKIEKIVGVYPAGKQPDYLEIINKIGDGLGHIHLADSSGLWQYTVSMPTGGLTLGTGEQIQDELLALLLQLEAHPTKEYTINLEVKDRDMQKLEETAQSLRYLSKLLHVKKT